MALQHLTLELDGITAGDYLAWVRDPEPPALGTSLRSIRVQADPLGDTVHAVLSWNGPPPCPAAAASAAGLPQTPEVAAMTARPRCEGRAPARSLSGRGSAARRSPV